MTLIATRSVPLIKGNAYINCTHFSIAASTFQFTNISNFLNKIKIGLNTVKLDPRMKDLIKEMEILVQKYYSSNNYFYCIILNLVNIILFQVYQKIGKR